MNELLLTSLSLSLLHATIPNHWLPIVAIGKKTGWTAMKTVRITAMAGSAHAAGTILIGIALSLLGWQLSNWIDIFSKIVAPAILIGLGVYFLYRHYFHRHFHMHGRISGSLNERQTIMALAMAMFLSPCMEIAAFFLLAGSHGAGAVLLLSTVYFLTTVGGMALWVWLVWRGLSMGNWHALEHNAGMISGLVLVLSGLWGIFHS